MANENGQRNLTVEEEAGLVTLTINRPEKRNALSVIRPRVCGELLYLAENSSAARSCEFDPFSIGSVAKLVEK